VRCADSQIRPGRFWKSHSLTLIDAENRITLENPMTLPHSVSTCHPQHRLAITLRAIAELLPDPRNPRLHSDRHVQQIADSIKAFGFNMPILIDKGGHVIGHRAPLRQGTQSRMSCTCAHGERFLPPRLLAVFFHQRDGKRGFDLGDVVGLLQHGDVRYASCRSSPL
jgi:hypothetical protein